MTNSAVCIIAANEEAGEFSFGGGLKTSINKVIAFIFVIFSVCFYFNQNAIDSFLPFKKLVVYPVYFNN